MVRSMNIISATKELGNHRVEPYWFYQYYRHCIYIKYTIYIYILVVTNADIRLVRADVIFLKKYL